MYTHNKYPRCCDSDALQELTPMLTGWWPTQKPYKKVLFFFKKNAVDHTPLPGG